MVQSVDFRKRNVMRLGMILGSAFVFGIAQLYAQEPVTKITLEPMGMNLVVGEQGTFKATVYPSNATNKTITWSSSEPDKFSVDSTGKVTALAPISTFPPRYITATDASGKVIQQGYVVVAEAKSNPGGYK